MYSVSVNDFSTTLILTQKSYRDDGRVGHDSEAANYPSLLQMHISHDVKSRSNHKIHEIQPTVRNDEQVEYSCHVIDNCKPMAYHRKKTMFSTTEKT